MDVFRTNFIVDCRCHTIVDRTQTAVHKIKMEGGLFSERVLWQRCSTNISRKYARL